MNQQNLIQRFRAKEKSRQVQGKGTYLHFDNRLKLTPALISYVTMPQKVAGHSFYPFIHGTLSVKKYDKALRKVKKKDRDIYYAAHRDSLVYSWYSVILGEALENLLTKQNLSRNVIAYRKLIVNGQNASNTHFAVQAFDFIKSYGECVTLAFDISHFFDNIDHVLLKEAWKSLLGVDELPLDHYKIFRTLTTFSYVDRKSIIRKLNLRLGKNIIFLKRYCTAKEFDTKIRSLIKVNDNKFGIPQGSPISALLSNIYLNKFDLGISNFINEKTGLYRRYSDDIIIVCRKDDANQAMQLVIDLLKEYKLQINDKKTEVVEFIEDNGRLIVNADKSNRPKLQYLGYEFDGQNYYIRSSSISRYFRKMKRGVRAVFSKRIIDMRGNKRYLRSIYERYSHLGSSNFITYVYRAANITGSEFIKRQAKSHWSKMKKEIQKYKNGTGEVS